jgi:hypothetical protein
MIASHLDRAGKDRPATQERKDVSILAKAQVETAADNTPLRVNLKFEGSVRRPFSSSISKSNEDLQARLRQWEGNDAALLRRASELSGDTLEDIIRTGAISNAKRLIFSIENQASKPKRGKATHGIQGSADARLEVAYAALLDGGVKKADISPTRLAKATKPKRTAFRTAERFMERRGLLPKDYHRRAGTAGIVAA